MNNRRRGLALARPALALEHCALRPGLHLGHPIAVEGLPDD